MIGSLLHLHMSFVAAVIAGSLLTLFPGSALAQGGVPLWTNHYSGVAGALAVDASGNVFVTGTSGSGTNADYATIKYSNAGVPLWTNRFDGPGKSSDEARAIAVDASGNAFVTGQSYNGSDLVSAAYATIKYSNTGVSMWTNRYGGLGNYSDEPWAVAVDGSGNVFVTGRSRADYVTIAYSNSGVPLWTNRYDGPANDYDFGTAIAVDNSGNVFVTGFSYDGGVHNDYATAAYSNSGEPLWTNRYDGPANGYDYATAIAVDGSGNVFVTGYSESGTNADYATIKYSNAGVPLWTNRFDGPANSRDGANAIAVDGNGNVHVTGYSYDANGFWDYATTKYSGAGVPLWTRRYSGPGNDDDYPYAIAVDSSDNVFVTGYSNNGTNYDLATLAYSNAGVPLWTNRHNGRATNLNYPAAISVDSSGNVFVTGTSSNGTNPAYVTIKYSSSVPPPHLDFQLVTNELILSWTNAGFNLQSSPALTGTFTNLLTAKSPYTNGLIGPQQFFRLIAK